MADSLTTPAVTLRTDVVDLPILEQMAVEHDWLSIRRTIGNGLSRVIVLDYHIRAYACRQEDTEPILRLGPWTVNVILERGMAVQPMVHIMADHDGYLPIGANIADWAVGEMPGVVCWAGARSWDATRFTLGWVAFTVAMIIAGQVVGFEAKPISRRGRDWQAKALRRGWLPTQPVSRPRDELLLLGKVQRPASESDNLGIEFDG